MRTVNDKNHRPHSSSSSDQSDERNSQPQKYYNSQQDMGYLRKEQPREADSDSLSEEDSSLDSPRRLAKRYGLGEGADRAEESAENSDKSIDKIEERIKKLQKDLEERIGKHKQQKAKQKKDEGKVKNSNSPLLPKRPDTGTTSHRRPEEKLLSNFQSQPKSKPTHDSQFQKGNKSSTRIKRPQEKIKVQSPKKEKLHRDIEEPKLISTKVNQKPRVDSKNARNEASHGHHGQQLFKANKQIEQLHKTIDQLKNENRRLKEQLHHRRNKKPSLQIDKLRQLTGEGDAKLQKQLQLLKIIEILEGKLKKSISRKLKKNKNTTTSSALLHKGLPASLLS